MARNNYQNLLVVLRELVMMSKKNSCFVFYLEIVYGYM